jgi:poly-D-alanine transfer protein DltD
LVRFAKPLVRLQTTIHLAQDHAQCVALLRLYRNHVERPPERSPAQLNWDRLIAEASSIPVPTAERATRFDLETNETNYEKLFERMLHTAEEWSDLDLLVRGLSDLGVRPLILCMPPNGTYYENAGVAHETILEFSKRIREVAGRYGATVDAFEDHDEDVNFLVDHHDHMSAKGWMYYNRDLDEFYHSNNGGLVAHARHGHRKHLAPN